MKNRYEIHGDIAIIFLNRQNGAPIQTIIDTDDLLRADEVPGAWCAQWNPSSRAFYVVSGRTPKRIRLHRWLLPSVAAAVIDHIDNDPLNNCRSNLRPATKAANALNRRALATTNTSGATGVYWHIESRKWRAYISIAGRKHQLGSFESFDDAVSARATAFGRVLIDELCESEAA